MQSKQTFPTATYRLQLNSSFGFQNAAQLISYLQALGISHLYLSPILKSKSGSTHGYDVINYDQINENIGTVADFSALAKALKKQAMGIILDIVPNHMYINDSGNRWWQDVLEYGANSAYANYFDINWESDTPNLLNKVLLPLLEESYSDALEREKFKVVYNHGLFIVDLSFIQLPTDPSSWRLILDPIVKCAEKKLSSDNEGLVELKSILALISTLPGMEIQKENKKAAQKTKEEIKKRLENLTTRGDELYRLINDFLQEFNGSKHIPHSFDRLETFLDEQHYRLCSWKFGNEHLNYRRFFDYTDLAGIKTENPEVFIATHKIFFAFMEKGLLDGLRIDHIDGLWDPQQYLEDLQSHCQLARKTQNHSVKEGKFEDDLYTVVEKILIGNETLRKEWCVHGTVGYEFLNDLNGIFIDQSNKMPMIETYQQFSGVTVKTSDLLHICKSSILRSSLASELRSLAEKLLQLSESDSLTIENLQEAIVNIIASFPVYRTYIRAVNEPINAEDKSFIHSAILDAKSRTDESNAFIYDWIQRVLLLNFSEESSEEKKEGWKNFVMNFQQLTAPVMAKGVEDTAFYRSYALSSINEVGADLDRFGISLDTFHEKIIARREAFPHSMLTTTTHDTKRSEDVRARINVLSEIPKEWKLAIDRWSTFNLRHKIYENEKVIPNANEEYLIYQTLVGSWLPEFNKNEIPVNYVNRIQAYMKKAIREAKINSNWHEPDLLHEKGVELFIEKILASDNIEFLEDFNNLVSKVIPAGMLNSLSQTTIKLTSPGIPDIYQGNEVWDFSLVDPDNRRPVNYQKRIALLKEIHEEESAQGEPFIRKMLDHPENGKIKLFATHKILQLRHKMSELFTHGIYLPLNVTGNGKSHIIAYARLHEENAVLVIVPRFFASLLDDCSGSEEQFPLNLKNEVFKKCSILLPTELKNFGFLNIFTNKVTEHQIGEKLGEIHIEECLDSFPLFVGLGFTNNTN